MALEFSSVELARLQREDDWDVNDLAQELAILLPSLIRDIPAASVRATATDANPSPIQMTDATTDQNAPFATYRRGDEVFTISIGPDGLTTDGGSPPSPSKPSVFAGSVASYLGSNQYSMTLISGGTVVATQLQGDAAFPHSNGTPAIIIKVSGAYYMQIPVWA